MPSDPEKCDPQIFEDGDSAAVLDACSHVAEWFVRRVAEESGQRVDWHYTAGRANVLFLGDHDKVIEAIKKLQPELEKEHIKEPDAICGSCDKSQKHHRQARVLMLYPPNSFGPFRRNSVGRQMLGEEPENP